MEFKTTFKVNNEVLSGILVRDNEDAKVDVINLHGAGTADKTRGLYLTPTFLNNSKSFFTFDFSGHGESTGSLSSSSLKKRVEEAKTAVEQFGNSKLIIIGSSMGGYIAIKMLELFSIETLILFCPGIYSKDAYAVPFTDEFSNVIRKPRSWVNSDAWGLLDNFSGKLLIFIGENDEVIPQGVIDLIETHSVNVVKKEIIKIPDCPHAIHKYISTHPDVQEMVVQKIAEFLN